MTVVQDVYKRQMHNPLKRSTVSCIRLLPHPVTSMNCLGHSGVLMGQKRLPMPPAMIRKIHLAKCLNEGDWENIRYDLDMRPVEGINGESRTEEIDVYKRQS